MDQSIDDEYADIFLSAIRTCRDYKPKFGERTKVGLTFDEFETLYASDQFYKWLGLNSPLVYSAHKAAGGLTSVYRQIGTGCERIIVRVLQNELGLSKEDSSWSYEIKRSNGTVGKLSLDGRIPLDKLRDPAKRARVDSWIKRSASKIGVSTEITAALNGAVFEVRQGYKSKDSKRQNADIANASTAYSQGLLPCVLLLSAQIDRDLVDRYSNAKWLILSGTLSGDPTNSSYEFLKNVVGYDLSSFFEKHSQEFRKELESIFTLILKS